MKPHIIHRIVMVLFSTVLFLSCSSDLDFDQVNNFTIEPVFVANLAYFDLKANDITGDGSGYQIPEVTEDFDVFKNRFLNERLTKAELDFEMENTINRAFKVEMMLIDQNNKTLETITLNVPPYVSGSSIKTYTTEVFEVERLALLKRTVKVGFAVTIEPGAVGVSGNLKLKSGATAYMKIE